MYFPAFGVLFDTFRHAKIDLFFFFTLVIVFLVGFMVCSNLLFGLQEISYSNVSKATMSLIRMTFTDFRYKVLRAANKKVALIFFMCYIVFIFLILLNLLLAVVISFFDGLR